MKYIILYFLTLLTACAQKDHTTNYDSSSAKNEKDNIDHLINNWHNAAATANLKDYIGFMDTAAIYIGTDASENWSTKEFEAFCKPYFEKGTTWDFKTIKRNIYTNDNNNTAWFDELLHTQMGVCRGSGILIYKNGIWKIKHYVLSMTIPNHISKDVTTIKKKHEQKWIEKFN